MQIKISPFDKLDPEQQKEILDYCNTHGTFKASRTFAEKLNMNPSNLYMKLRTVRGENKKTEGLGKPSDLVPKKAGRPKKSEEKEIENKLTAADKRLLKRLEKGEVDLEEMSRILATRVFEKVLRNPEDVKFIDLFRTQLLKIKQDENKIKEDYAKTIVARLFAGQLPPEHCPKCGINIFERQAFNQKREQDELKALEGETLDAN